MEDIKINDNVLFGAYGNFDDATECKVVGIEETPYSELMGKVKYTLKTKSGHEFGAFSDEVRKI